MTWGHFAEWRRLTSWIIDVNLAFIWHIIGNQVWKYIWTIINILANQPTPLIKRTPLRNKGLIINTALSREING